MKLLRRALPALSLTSVLAGALRMRGKGGVPPQHGGWRELPCRARDWPQVDDDVHVVSLADDPADVAMMLSEHATSPTLNESRRVSATRRDRFTARLPLVSSGSRTV